MKAGIHSVSTKAIKDCGASVENGHDGWKIEVDNGDAPKIMRAFSGDYTIAEVEAVLRDMRNVQVELDKKGSLVAHVELDGIDTRHFQVCMAYRTLLNPLSYSEQGMELGNQMLTALQMFDTERADPNVELHRLLNTMVLIEDLIKQMRGLVRG